MILDFSEILKEFVLRRIDDLVYIVEEGRSNSRDGSLNKISKGFGFDDFWAYGRSIPFI